MARTPLKPLSEAIFEPVTKAYKAGGLGLAFLGLGAFLMLAAFFVPGRGTLSYLIVGTGFLLIVLTCALFFFKDVLPLFRTRRSIRQNKELIDAIQSTALQMTEVTSDLQALAFKHANTAASMIHEMRPMLRQLPLIGQFADSDVVVKADSLSRAIVEYTTKAKAVVADVEDALVRSDATRLKTYVAQLRELRADVENLLKA